MTCSHTPTHPHTHTHTHTDRQHISARTHTHTYLHTHTHIRTHRRVYVYIYIYIYIYIHTHTHTSAFTFIHNDCDRITSHNYKLHTYHHNHLATTAICSTTSSYPNTCILPLLPSFRKSIKSCSHCNI